MGATHGPTPPPWLVRTVVFLLLTSSPVVLGSAAHPLTDALCNAHETIAQLHRDAAPWLALHSRGDAITSEHVEAARKSEEYATSIGVIVLHGKVYTHFTHTNGHETFEDLMRFPWDGVLREVQRVARRLGSTAAHCEFFINHRDSPRLFGDVRGKPLLLSFGSRNYTHEATPKTHRLNSFDVRMPHYYVRPEAECARDYCGVGGKTGEVHALLDASVPAVGPPMPCWSERESRVFGRDSHFCFSPSVTLCV